MTTHQILLDPNAHREIITNLTAKLNAYYVFPEVAEQISTQLQEQLASGAYAHLTEGALFAKTLSEQMQAVNGDKHLQVWWQSQPLPEDEGPMHENQERLNEWRQVAALENYGLPKVERLAGNVGYLDIRAFYEPAWGGETAAAAMNFLANTHILIMDLRQCCGGDPHMVAFISSYLFGEEPVHLNSFYWRAENSIQQFWTSPYVPGKRYANPIYVLTSKTTFSGGEEFAYNLQTRQRATLVGETTGGGAHPGGTYRVHPYLEVFIPSGRAINPITNANWEGCGVAPDIAVAQEEALMVAHRLALTAILTKLGDAQTGPLRQLREEVQAALKVLEADSIASDETISLDNMNKENQRD
ncbi:MAG: S41 family peptidase [Caldilineaceae bacterium]